MGIGARLNGNEKQRIKINQYREQGLCIRCRKNKVKDYATCDTCLVKSRKAYLKKTQSHGEASLGEGI